MSQEAFIITGGKGYQMTFDNGWMVSVQWGAGNCCDNRNATCLSQSYLGAAGSATAEVAVFNPEGKCVKPIADLDGGCVYTWQTADDVARMMATVAAISSQSGGKP